MKKLLAALALALSLVAPAHAQNPGVRQQGTVTAGQCAIWVTFNVVQGGACGGSASLDVGTSPITNGTNNRIFYQTSGAVLGQITGWTSNGTNSITGNGTTPQAILGANGGNVGGLKFFGSTSGDATVTVAAAAGTATRFQLPPTNGSNTNLLQSDGSGNTSWVAATTPCTSTALSLQYNNAGAFGCVSGWTTNGSTALTGGASTTLAVGNCTIGGNAFCVTGTSALSGQVTNALGTITTSQPFTLTQTWNAGGVAFTGILLNITATASSASSNLLDLQNGGATKFQVDRNGGLQVPSANTSYIQDAAAVRFRIEAGANPYMTVDGGGTGYFGFANNNNAGTFARISMASAGVLQIGTTATNALGSINLFNLTSSGTLTGDTLAVVTSSGFTNGMLVAFTGTVVKAGLVAGGQFAWTSNTTNAGGAADTIITRAAAATFQWGAASSATPVNQIAQAQGSRGGTDTNIAGGNLTLRPGAGTGNATGAILSLQSPVPTSTGTTQQSFLTGAYIQNGQLVTNGNALASLPAGIQGARAFIVDQLTACPATGVALTGGGAVVCPAFFNGSAWVGG